mmetsp:Transcript_27165/g.47397  ORF Transcript_27165/g.47397 Transcript_27165/m.47397 type:complete len:276 (+) Transcript_27165:41-868(+)
MGQAGFKDNTGEKVPSPTSLAPPFGLKVVCVSDTHGRHRKVNVPAGDVLIHAGDWTHFGKLRDVTDFNEWLGEQPHKHKIVINGNHEHNAPWKHEVRKLLSNATHFLCDESCVIECPSQGGVVSEAADSGVMVSGGDGGGPRRPSQDSVVSEPADSGVMASGGDDGGPQRTLKIHGTNFFWPMTTPNPYYGAIADDVDVLLCHGPCYGFCDNSTGCRTMLQHVERVRPRLVVSGHIHSAHGVMEGTGRTSGTTFINAANAKEGYSMGWDAVVVDI